MIQIPNILMNEDAQLFIHKHIGDDVRKLALKYSKEKSISINKLLEQIASAQRIKTKIPSWYLFKNIIYPPVANLEQSSSEITALFKANLLTTLVYKR